MKVFILIRCSRTSDEMEIVAVYSSYSKALKRILSFEDDFCYYIDVHTVE